MRSLLPADYATVLGFVDKPYEHAEGLENREGTLQDLGDTTGQASLLRLLTRLGLTVAAGNNDEEHGRTPAASTV